MLGAGRRRAEANLDEDEDALAEPEESNVEEGMSHETEVDLLKRTTGLVEDQLRKNSLDDWYTAARRLKIALGWPPHGKEGRRPLVHTIAGLGAAGGTQKPRASL